MSGDGEALGGDVAELNSRLETRNSLAVTQLINRHWAYVDRSIDGAVEELFCEDGEMHIGNLIRLGRKDIANYYAERRSQEDASGRKTRHLITNMICDDQPNGDIDVYFLASVYSGVGSFPLPSDAPSTIADFTGICRRTTDEGWRIAELRAAITFVGPGAPKFAKKESSVD